MSSKSTQYNRNEKGYLKSVTEKTTRSDGSTYSKTTGYPSGLWLELSSEVLIADPADDRARLEGSPGDPDATGASA